MLIDQDLAAFMASPVMIILGSCDNFLLPQIGRSVGAVVHAAEGRVDLVVSSLQWPTTIANVRENGRLSATFARPSDYVSYQVKGRASVAPASAECLKRSKHYIETTTATLAALGLDPRFMTPQFVDREPMVLCLSIETAFIQTPGERAGQMLERRR